MQVAARMFPNDVELGKKDDDHKRPRHSQWMPWRRPLRYRKRRILLGIACCSLLWLLVRNITPYLTGTAPDSLPAETPRSVPPRYSERAFRTQPNEPPLSSTPTPTDVAVEENKYYYDGEINFYKFASTLTKASSMMGFRYYNRNVVFAASDLRSASTLITMACEMSKQDRNYVHMVVMGRDNLPMDEILEVNGVDLEACRVLWHDARPDYTEYSTESRAEDSVVSAVGHLQNYLHPQVIITDDAQNEDGFFTRGIRAKTKTLNIPVIEIPKDASHKLMWMTRLDAGALRSWHRPSVDILIQAPAKSSGSLLRLLKSLYAADYTGLKPPRLIIDLPAEMDPLIKQFMESFVWPPTLLTTENPFSGNQLVLHHRILSRRASPEEASARFLESFYPIQPLDSHVLVLSPQAQVSPLFYHYIRYNLLEYRHTTYPPVDSSNLFGISLELPSKYLNGTTDFVAPHADLILESKYKSGPGVSSVPFLWDAPNSNAALYFGSKWVEMHSYLTYRLAAEEEMSTKPAKVMPQTLPAWTEYALEFMRARGYSVLYPGSVSGESLVTVHNEIHKVPEEYDLPPTTESEDTKKEEGASDVPDNTVLHANTDKPKPIRSELPISQSSRALHEILPFSAELPELSFLPRLSYAGDILDYSTSISLQQSYLAQFRKVIGGCEPEPEGIKRKVKEGSAKDLFCFGDETEDDFEEDFSSPLVFQERSKFGVPYERSLWPDDNIRRIDREEEGTTTSSSVAEHTATSASDEAESMSSTATAEATGAVEV